MKKVLIVDDEPYVLEGLRTLVDWEKNGFVLCGEASDGEDALDLIRSKDPDLVITDIRMPVFDGLTLIRKAKEELAVRSKFVILSGHADFSYAKTAIRYRVKHYLSKPIMSDEVEQVIAKVRTELEQEKTSDRFDERILASAAESAISGWMKGERPDELCAHAAQVSGVNENSSFIVIIGEIENYSESGMSRRSGVKEIGIARRIASDLSGEYNVYLFEESESRFGIAIRDCKRTGKEFERQLAHIGERLQQWTGWTVSFYVSSRGRGISMLPDLYRQAQLSSTLRLASKTAGVFRYSEHSGNSDCISRLSGETSDLVEMIASVSGKPGEVRERMERFCSELARCNADPADILFVIGSFQTEMIDLISRRGGSSDRLMPYLLGLRGSCYPFLPSSVKDNLAAFAAVAAETLDELKRNAFGHPIMAQIIDYVNTHYREKLELRILAEEFGIHPVNLGQLFKKKTGMPFHDYLHHCRIEEAKKLLSRSNMKISEVAKTVGYSDPEYFAEKFKSIVKCLPSAYYKFEERNSNQ
ncbi:response regulator transcription factor [Paenibacillus alkalitolerans]|uniref:response regulator transcription factor n=1 Tax=Paenibacillus alkalitolerans TaxID=2799335 RepID=UPI0018F74231|nr:response regulator [Paenibacillus alkalitolerans]